MNEALKVVEAARRHNCWKVIMGGCDICDALVMFDAANIPDAERAKGEQSVGK